MKIFIQSKTGNHNCVIDVLSAETEITEGFLKAVLRGIRADGGYYLMTEKGQKRMVPFEEIEFIRKLSEYD